MIGFGGVAKVPPFLFLRDGRLPTEPLQAARRRVFGVYEWYALRTKNSCISTWFHVCLFHTSDSMCFCSDVMSIFMLRRNDCAYHKALAVGPLNICCMICQMRSWLRP